MSVTCINQPLLKRTNVYTPWNSFLHIYLDLFGYLLVSRTQSTRNNFWRISPFCVPPKKSTVATKESRKISLLPNTDCRYTVQCFHYIRCAALCTKVYFIFCLNSNIHKTAEDGCLMKKKYDLDTRKILAGLADFLALARSDEASENLWASIK